MNKARRVEINKVTGEIEELISRLETVRDEEQDAFDNMPESLQGSERGEKAEAAIEALSYAIDQLEEAKNSAEEALDE